MNIFHMTLSEAGKLLETTRKNATNGILKESFL